MAQRKKTSLESALENLQKALEQYQSRAANDPLPRLTVAKAFEVAVEYGWRELKMRVQNEGLDTPSPKAAIREAAKLGFITNAKTWFIAIEARNSSVHGYFGIDDNEFIEIAKRFFKLASQIA
ncbi:MAG: nucleotidyltransferase substrate binding protein [Pseudomonadota bacterium]